MQKIIQMKIQQELNNKEKKAELSTKQKQRTLTIDLLGSPTPVIFE